MSKYMNSQRGIGMVVEIILGALVLAAIGFGVMQYMKHKDGGAGSSLIPASVTLNGNCEYKDTDLCKFVNNWQVNGNYSMTSSSVQDSEKSTMIFEIAVKANHT